MIRLSHTQAWETLITVLVLSYTIFAIVQIPPGDAVDRQVQLRRSRETVVTREEIETLRAQYGLDRPDPRPLL